MAPPVDGQLDRSKATAPSAAAPSGRSCSRRSACLVTRLRSYASAWPIMATASDAPVITPGVAPANAPDLVKTPSQTLRTDHFDAPTAHAPKQLHNAAKSALPRRQRNFGGFVRYWSPLVTKSHINIHLGHGPPET